MVINGLGPVVKDGGGDYIVLISYDPDTPSYWQFQTLQDALDFLSTCRETGGKTLVKLVRLTVDELGVKPPGDMPF